MKIISLLLVSFMLSNCGNTKNLQKAPMSTAEAPFSISNASSQDWVAGVEGGGSGTYVDIEMNDLPEGISFKEIHFRGLVSDIVMMPNANNTARGSFTTSLNQDVIMDADPLKEAQNAPQRKSNYTLQNNEVILVYVLDGETNYVKVENVVEKPMLAYPSANPDQGGMGIGN